MSIIAPITSAVKPVSAHTVKPKRSPRQSCGPQTPNPVQPIMCGSCIFRQDGKQAELSPGRLDAIRAYLIEATPHECHYPQTHGQNKHIVCRGGRDYQLMIWHRMGLIAAPTDEALHEKMVSLGIWQDAAESEAAK